MRRSGHWGIGALGLLACSAPAREAGFVVDTGRVAVPGSSIYWEASGSGSPVILLHGGNLDRRMWDSEFVALRATHRVIRFDARGYGKSGRIDTTFAAHDDLLAVMDRLSIQRASLVGLSLGGRIAIDFALAHPDRVDRLVLAAPGISGGKWIEEHGDTTWQAAARAAAQNRDSVALALSWLGSAYISTALRDSATAVWVRGIVVDQAPFWMDLIRNGRDLEQEAVPPAAGRLAELRMPILLLVGSDDTPFIRDIARAIQATSPNVRRVDFPGVGHMINLEARDQFQKSVTGFLNGEPR
ncbi:MAG TPA: alpha/beta hydrolase [Gemmatimonadales bacterium]|nr:alpha/beta hydrolase [Gemmatimonadales bacterium]